MFDGDRYVSISGATATVIQYSYVLTGSVYRKTINENLVVCIEPLENLM